MTKSLIGQRIFVRENEFTDQDISAKIAIVDDQSLLLEFDKPLINGTKSYSRAVASPRLPKSSVNSLLVNGLLSCSVTWIPDVKYNGSKPLDLNWWRGGAVAITDLYTEYYIIACNNYSKL